jgi:hypothetical protein
MSGLSVTSLVKTRILGSGAAADRRKLVADSDTHAPWWKQLKQTLWALLPMDALL